MLQNSGGETSLNVTIWKAKEMAEYNKNVINSKVRTGSGFCPWQDLALAIWKLWILLSSSQL